MYKEIISGFAFVLTMAGFGPYIQSILKGKTKPHVFSWMLWGLATFTVFFAQMADGAGVGAWPIGFSGVVSVFVAVLAYQRKSDTTITKSDWVFFSLGVLSLPLWYVTADPLWAVLLLTTIDVFAFIPTFRKSFLKPFDENLQFYMIMTIRNIIVIGALEHFSVTTILFPLAGGVLGIALILMLVVRRKLAKNLN